MNEGRMMDKGMVKQQQIKACIFDLDGVICDTAKYHYLAWKRLADSLEIPFTEQDNERLKGVSRIDSLNILLSLGGKIYSEEEKRLFAEQKNRDYVDLVSRMGEDEILPGVLDTILYLRDQGIKIALGSVSKNAPMILERLHLNKYFDMVVDGSMVVHAKPDPEVFLLGAKGLKVKAEECVVFEDALAGIQAAKAAGMMAVGIGLAENLPGADFVIGGFEDMGVEELMERIGGLG